MMLVNRAQQAVVLVEVVDVLPPEVGRRQHEAVVFGEENIFVRSFYVFNV